MTQTLIDGIEAVDVETGRLRMQVLKRGSDSDSGRPLIFVHGNCSSALFFQRLMLDLPAGLRPLAVDLRGFGGSETKPVDATRGLADFADDLWALCDTLGLERVDLFGWSMGGGVVLKAILDQPARVRSATLENPVSPYGYGGTKGADGRLCFPDGAGAGAGGANPRFVELLGMGDADGTRNADGSVESASPRATLRGYYLAPREWPTPDEEVWVASILSTTTGEDNYPGDSVPSPNWPGTAPGTHGVLNSLAPQYCRLDGIVDVSPKPPILWVRGEKDLIVSDAALFDLATLGTLGYLPNWPGADVIPSQPMVTQTRAVLQRYQAAGGRYTELAMPGAGHTPHLEAPDEVREALLTHLGAADD